MELCLHFPSIRLHELQRDSSNLNFTHECLVCKAAVLLVTRRLVTAGCFVFTLVLYWSLVRKLRDAQGPRKVTAHIPIICLIPPAISWFPLTHSASTRH